VRLGRSLAGGTVLAVLAGGGYAAWAQASEPSAAYRTATVSRADVEQQLELTGTLAATGTHDLSFGASGTVATVDVTVGEQVRQGQQLGTLDRTSLRTADQKARAALAAAEAQLEDDEATQAEQVAAADDSSESSSPGSDNPSADPTFQPAQGSSDEPSGGPDPMELLHQQQEAVTAAQTTASGALAAAQDALTHQTETCTASPGEQVCAEALAAVQTAQQQVATAQTALQDAIGALTQTLSQALKDLEQQSSTEQPTQEPSQQPTQQPQAQTEPQASQEPTITAATLARDQASIEQAKADLVDADQALAGAVVTAPKAGRVVQVTVEQSGSATAGGSAFVVVAPGTTTVTLPVSDTQLRSLAVGQSATVTLVGSEHGYRAKVTYVDPVPDTSTDTTTYAVTVTLDKQGLSLPNGAPASVSVLVGEASGVLTVPTSAVSNGTVSVLKGDEVTLRPVTTGIVGTTRTEVTDGLSLGDEVVVADLNQPLPSSGNQQNEFRGPTSGFGGNGPVVVGPR
jgi:multidrug efflux pump subunit AcrA (membrane-fusion protein)